jgi:hypothetical protein
MTTFHEIKFDTFSNADVDLYDGDDLTSRDGRAVKIISGTRRRYYVFVGGKCELEADSALVVAAFLNRLGVGVK